MTNSSSPGALSHLTLARGVQAYALEHYAEGGWDVLAEAWTPDMIADKLREDDVRTIQDAIKSFSTVVSVWKDRQADAIISGGGTLPPTFIP
jgi:hypothetical protein